MTCLEGHVAPEEILFCSKGQWQVRGECHLEGLNRSTSQAVQALLRLELEGAEGPAKSMVFEDFS